VNSLLKYKGLLLATLSLVLFFLFYLAVNLVVQSRAFSDASYADSINALSTQTFAEMSPTQVDELTEKLSVYEQGGVVQIDGKENTIVRLDKFLSPAKSNLAAIISLLKTGEIAEAQQMASGLSDKIVRQKERKLSLIRYLQFAAAVVTVLLYLLFVVPMIMRISRDDDTEVAVKDEAAGIMSTVSEGLFLLNHDHEIGIEQSASLKEMFKLERDLEGNFFDFIGQFVPQNTVQIAKDYLDLLFGERVKEKLVRDLNPLNQVEISIVRRDGSYETRFLDFRFNRVMENDSLSHLLVSVTDQTRSVMLERQLAESKEEQEAQLELLMSILHIDANQLRGFFDSADLNLNEINDTLESPGHGNTEIRKKVSEIARVTHRLKGDAAALGLHKFEFTAHAFEEELSAIQNENEVISGKQLLPAITKLKDLFAELDNMRSLVDKFSNAMAGDQDTSGLTDQAFSSAPVTLNNKQPVSGRVGVLQDLVSRVAERTGKRANLSTFGLDDESLPDYLEEPIQSIVVQLIRNSIVHGALDPSERIGLGKTDYINIISSFTELDDNYVLLVRDDGEGFNEQKIIKRAIDLELITETQAARLAPGSAPKLIFKSGFSNLEDADLDGGRGVGLDVVHAMTKKLGGTVSVGAREGKFCQFKITIPKLQAPVSENA